MPKDKKNLAQQTQSVVLGDSPLTTGLSNTLASFGDARDTAFKNNQAEAIASSENSNSKNITKPSRRNKSNTLIGLAKLQGFRGAKKKAV
jgi:hypothetical protein